MPGRNAIFWASAVSKPPGSANTSDKKPGRSRAKGRHRLSSDTVNGKHVFCLRGTEFGRIQGHFDKFLYDHDSVFH